MAREKRFVRVFNEGTLEGACVLVDTQTGVNYLFYAAGYAGGLTPLLDASGNVVVTPYIKEE